MFENRYHSKNKQKCSNNVRYSLKLSLSIFSLFLVYLFCHKKNKKLCNNDLYFCISKLEPFKKVRYLHFQLIRSKLFCQPH